MSNMTTLHCGTNRSSVARKHGCKRLRVLGANGRRVACSSSLEPAEIRKASNASATTEFVAETLLPTRYGKFRLRGYRHTVDQKTASEPTAIIYGNPEGLSEVAVRVHDACFTSEVLGSMKCDCAEQLELALAYIRTNSPGLVIYLQQEGRGIGLANKIAAYSLQEQGFDTVDANRELGLPDDAREYSSVRNILADLDIKSIRLITNNPRKIMLLEELGMNVVGRIPCIVQPGEHSEGYLEVKGRRMQHMDIGTASESEDPIDEQTF